MEVLEKISFKANFSYYNPKGFKKYEKTWIIPFSEKLLLEFDIEILR